MKNCFVFYAAVFVLFTGGVSTHAEETSFTVSPMTREFSLAPGTQQTQTLSVKNDTPAGTLQAPLRLKVYAMDWTLSRDGTPQFADAGTLPGSCSLWIQVNPTEILLLPGQTQTVRCTLTVPPNVQGASHTMLMFQAAPNPMTLQSGKVTVSGRIGAALYVSVGPQARRARITSFSVGPQKTLLTVENTGNSLLRLHGTLQFSDADGKQIVTVVPPVVLLPGTDNVRDIYLDTPVAPAGTSLSSVTALLDYGGNVLLGARARVTAP